MRVHSHYRRKARRRLKTVTRSMSAAVASDDGDKDKKNCELQTGSRHRTECHRTGARSATMQAPRQRQAMDLGDPGTRRTSWQRVRPLPIPRLPPPPLPPPLDDSPVAPVSPPDAEVPLLSTLSLRVSAESRRCDPPPSRSVCYRRPPNGERSVDVGQRRLTTSGDSSPYYFKLDPALTARQSDRRQRFYSHNPCFMCESEIR